VLAVRQEGASGGREVGHVGLERTSVDGPGEHRGGTLGDRPVDRDKQLGI
jgi:hypothetical protein